MSFLNGDNHSLGVFLSVQQLATERAERTGPTDGILYGFLGPLFDSKFEYICVELLQITLIWGVSFPNVAAWLNPSTTITTNSCSDFRLTRSEFKGVLLRCGPQLVVCIGIILLSDNYRRAPAYLFV